MQRSLTFLAIAFIALTGTAAAAPGPGKNFDFGVFRDNQLRAHSNHLFGIEGPLEQSSRVSVGAAVADADPRTLATVAKSLSVRVVASSPSLAPNIDMMVLFPEGNPSHIIA
jgi:hypothetical protein